MPIRVRQTSTTHDRPGGLPGPTYDYPASGVHGGTIRTEVEADEPVTVTLEPDELRHIVLALYAQIPVTRVGNAQVTPDLLKKRSEILNLLAKIGVSAGDLDVLGRH